MDADIRMTDMFTVAKEVGCWLADPDAVKFAPASIAEVLKESFDKKCRALDKSKLMAEKACMYYCRANLVNWYESYYQQVLGYMRLSIVKFEFDRTLVSKSSAKGRLTRKANQYKAAMAGLMEINALYIAHKTYNLS